MLGGCLAKVKLVNDELFRMVGRFAKSKDDPSRERRRGGMEKNWELLCWVQGLRNLNGNGTDSFFGKHMVVTLNMETPL